MHILLLTPGFPEDEHDHLCMPYLQLFLERILRDYVEVSFSIVSFQYPYKAKNYRWKGINVAACGGDNRSFPKRLLTWRKVLKSINAIHAKKPVSVVHTLWLNECAYLGQRWANKQNIPHVCTAMGQDVLAGNRYLKRLDLSRINTVAVSEDQAAKMYSTTGKKPENVIPWGMDAPNFNLEKRTIDVLGVGSLIPLKKYDEFIKTIATLKKSQPKIKAVLVGYGPEMEKLKQLSSSLGLDDNVTFTGELDRPKVLKRMAQSSVFLHPSNFESQGFVFNEALACGMRIVSRKVGIATESGRWKTVDKGQSLSESVAQLLAEPPCKSAQTIYPLHKTTSEYFKLYLVLS